MLIPEAWPTEEITLGAQLSCVRLPRPWSARGRRLQLPVYGPPAQLAQQARRADGMQVTLVVQNMAKT